MTDTIIVAILSLIGTLGGSSLGVLAVHDISPAEHALNIKLSSDTLTDFSNVGVSRYGKNLITAQEFYKGCL